MTIKRSKHTQKFLGNIDVLPYDPVKPNPDGDTTGRFRNLPIQPMSLRASRRQNTARTEKDEVEIMFKLHQKYHIDLMDCAIYLIVSLVAQTSVYIAASLFNSLLNMVQNTFSITFSYIVYRILSYTIMILVPILVITVFFKYSIKNIYKHHDNSNTWLKTGLLYIMPGEILRLVISTIPMNFTGMFIPTNFGMAFAAICAQIFQKTYGVWSGRLYEVSTFEMTSFNIHLMDVEGPQFIPMDFIAYIICHLLYLIPHVFIILCIYRHYWNKCEKEYQIMIHNNTQGQPKGIVKS